MNKIKSGFFAITEVLNSTRHVEYNWWHSSDHQPENLAIDGIVYARRWAAPQKLMDARVAVHQAIERHQYLAHYMFTEPLDEAITAFHELGSWCRNNNRFFEDRNIHSFGFHRFIKGYVAPGIEVSPDALPYRPHRGVFVVMKHVHDTSGAQAMAKWQDEVHTPDVLELKGVSGCYWFSSAQESVTEPAEIGTAATRHVFVYYLESEPLSFMNELKDAAPRWQREGRLMDTSATSEVILAAPYEDIEDPENYDWTKR